MEVYEDLLNWAKEQGIELHGIEPRPLPGRGIGVVATKSIKENDILLKVPTSSLRTSKTVCKEVSSRLPTGTRVHGLLAADFLLNKQPNYAPWNAVLPSREDVWASMPLTWDRHLHEFLPPSARQLLKKQEAKFDRDWQAVHNAFPQISRADYLYAWALVNTRTFYYDGGGSSSNGKKPPPHDCMALQPVADLLNHHPTQGAKVTFSAEGCAIRATKTYTPGEEIYICYGNHGNDFLLTEYGFLLDENKWDEICLDEAILPELSGRQKDMLADEDFLGNYMLDSNGVCYRTLVALRLLALSLIEWRRYLDGPFNVDDEVQQGEVDRELARILEKYRRGTIAKMIGKIEESTAGEESQRKMLIRRWEQIGELIDRTIENLRV
ncbi:putative set domain containing protein [Rhypophila decipiens]